MGPRSRVGTGMEFKEKIVLQGIKEGKSQQGKHAKQKYYTNMSLMRLRSLGVMDVKLGGGKPIAQGGD